MTTPLRRKGIYDKEENKTPTIQTNRSETRSVLLRVLGRLNCKLLYLFLSCSEFNLPALVGHTAALVYGPRCYGAYCLPAENSILSAGARTRSSWRSWQLTQLTTVFEVEVSENKVMGCMRYLAEEEIRWDERILYVELSLVNEMTPSGTQIFKRQSNCVSLTRVISFMVLIVWVKYLHFCV